MDDQIITDVLLDGRSIIIVGPASEEDKIVAFQNLVDRAADQYKLAIIDEHHVLPTVPPSATVIDAEFKGVDAIHRTIRDDDIHTVAVPTMRRGDIVRMLMDFAGQENGQVLMLNGAASDAVTTLTEDLPMILLRVSPSGHTEFSDAAIKAMDPVVVELDKNGNVESILEVDKHAAGIHTIALQ